MNEAGRPVAQQMVDDGTLLGWGMMTHSWGDEWNVLFYLATPDGTDFMETAGELQNRQIEAFGDESNARFLENCTEHKDSIYTWRMFTTGGEGGENPTMGVSYWKCNLGYVGDLIEEMREVGLPIAQEMVDDGSLFVSGMMTHAWGDEWNVMFYTATPDGMPFIDTAEELNDRQNEAFGDESGARFLENCSEHKDNIYTWQMRTEVPAN